MYVIAKRQQMRVARERVFLLFFDLRSGYVLVAGARVSFVIMRHSIDCICECLHNVPLQLVVFSC